MLEDLNTVHGLTKEIEQLRKGEEGGEVEGASPTPGQLWKRLLDLGVEKRMETIKSLIDVSQKGIECTLMLHEDDLNRNAQEIDELRRERARWNTINRLLSVYIESLRKNQKESIEQGTVADRLELFLKGAGNGPVENPGKVLCGHQWSEAGRHFRCAEPVDGSGLHQGEHHAYVREGDAADEELRMKYLEDENDELRRRLGLPGNRRITR